MKTIIKISLTEENLKELLKKGERSISIISGVDKNKPDSTTVVIEKSSKDKKSVIISQILEEF